MAYAGDNITINLYLAAPLAPGASFQNILLLVDEAAGNGLNGDRYRKYRNASEAETDYDASYITAAVYAGCVDFFAQPGSNHTLFVGRVDTGGGESYSDGFDACKTSLAAASESFYGVACDSRTGADILLVAADVETDAYRLFSFASNDADWLTASVPAAFSGIEDRERSIGTYHDQTAEWPDLCALGNRLDFDPDNDAPSWPCYLKEVANNTTDPDASQQGNLEGNDMNLGLEWKSASYWWGNGITMKDRPIEHMVAVDWFAVRVDEDLVAFAQQKSVFGEKIPVDIRGQRMITGLIDARLQRGIQVGHFLTESPTDSDKKTQVTAETITTADIAARRLRFTVQLVWETGAIAFTINTYAQAA